MYHRLIALAALILGAVGIVAPAHADGWSAWKTFDSHKGVKVEWRTYSRPNNDTIGADWPDTMADWRVTNNSGQSLFRLYLGWRDYTCSSGSGVYAIGAILGNVEVRPGESFTLAGGGGGNWIGADGFDRDSCDSIVDAHFDSRAAILKFALGGPTEQVKPWTEHTFAGASQQDALGQGRDYRRQIQTALTDAGFDPGPADGIFGPRTRRAVQAWQAAHGYGATGYLTRTQADMLIPAGGSNAATDRARRVASGAAQPETTAPEAKDEQEDKQRTARDKTELKARAGTTFRDCEDCPEMVVVPAGSFDMGSLIAGDDYDKPVHRVIIDASFAVGKFEVTRAEYSQFASETGYSTGNSCVTHEDIDNIGWWRLRDGRNWRRPGFSQTKLDPVVCVSWDDAKAYVAWLGRRTGEEYRLLSESEWEYAARAGTRTRYFWGEEWDEQCRYANATDESVRSVPHGDWNGSAFPPCNDGHVYTSPAGSFAANPFGIFDMIGNVWEWVEDCWHDSYAGAPSDGSAWTTGSDCNLRVVRGGSWFPKIGDVHWWFYNSYVIQPSARSAYGEARSSSLGFRVARTLSGGVGTVSGLIGDSAQASQPLGQPARDDEATEEAESKVHPLAAQSKKFSDALGRPYSADAKEEGSQWTDLHSAALLDLPEVINALLDGGLAVDMRLGATYGSDVQRALEAASTREDFIFERWEPWGQSANGHTPLMIAAYANAHGALKALIAGGADINAKDDLGQTLLHLATRRNQREFAELLIELGADLNARDKSSKDSSGYWYGRNETPLAKAVLRNHLEMAKVLVDHGADVNAREGIPRGATILHLAVDASGGYGEYDTRAMIRMLVERGADINATDDWSKTPLDWATTPGEKDKYGIAQLLRHLGGRCVRCAK